MKYEIEIPDGVIPDTHEPFAFRKPVDGEECVSVTGKVFTSSSRLGEPRLILRKTWQWPEWLDAEELRWGGNYWIARMTGPDGIPIMWSIMWEVINYPQPPNKSRVYTNPRKNVKGGE